YFFPCLGISSSRRIRICPPAARRQAHRGQRTGHPSLGNRESPLHRPTAPGNRESPATAPPPGTLPPLALVLASAGILAGCSLFPLAGRSGGAGYPVTSRPIERAVPAIIDMAPSMSVAFRSGIFVSAICRI